MFSCSFLLLSSISPFYSVQNPLHMEWCCPRWAHQLTQDNPATDRPTSKPYPNNPSLTLFPGDYRLCQIDKASYHSGLWVTQEAMSMWSSKWMCLWHHPGMSTTLISDKWRNSYAFSPEWDSEELRRIPSDPCVDADSMCKTCPFSARIYMDWKLLPYRDCSY